MVRKEIEKFDLKLVEEELIPYEDVVDFESYYSAGDYEDWLIEIGVIDPNYRDWIKGTV